MKNYSPAQKDEITRRIIKLIDNSQLFIEHELTIVNMILKKYNFRTIPNTAKEINKSKQSLYNHIGKDDFPHIVIDNVPFACVNFLKAKNPAIK